jgi:hypothetical protein
MHPCGCRGRRSFSSAEGQEEMMAVERVCGSSQAQVSCRPSRVPCEGAGAAGCREHQAPEQGRGAGGTEWGSGRPMSPSVTSPMNASIRED